MGVVRWGAGTPCHGLGGSHDRDAFPRGSGGREPEIEVLAGLGSCHLSPWLADGCLLPVSSHRFSWCVSVSSSCVKDTSQTG